MMASIVDKAARFADLHRAGCFAMPNAWDVGSARMLAGLGAKAIATASAGLAGTLGLADGAVKRDAALAHAKALVAAVDIPVSADLENGYADRPDGVAETVRLAIDAGLAGCSIEDKEHGGPAFYDAGLAKERVAAALEQSVSAGRPFTITARADGVLAGAYDLDEAMNRALAFADLGAPVVFVPGIEEGEALKDLCARCPAAISHLAGISKPGMTIQGLAERGVRRVSTGPMLYRAAMGAAAKAAAALLKDGDVTALVEKPGWADAARAMKAGS